MKLSSDASAPRDSSNGHRLVRAAETYLEAHSAEKFSLQSVAGALYVNGSYLLRVYKAETGQTLLGYHNRIRCEKAKALLDSTDLSISAIAETVGYMTSSHFTHVFRKLTGQTPTAYRHRTDQKEGIE